MNSLKLNRVFWALIPFAVLLIILFTIEQSRVFLIALFLRLFLLLKKHIVLILTSFFLVKGKFILSLFLKKLTLISATGLGKRYVIERIISKNFKIHFIDHIGNDVKRLVAYVKDHFKEFPLMNRIVALFTFLGSLGVVGKLMGGILVLKVLVARFWSLLLSVVLKVGTGVAYFFTDIFWGSWVAPIVEIVLFTWLLEFLEKIPFLKKFFAAVYAFLLSVFEDFEDVLERFFHLPVRKFLRSIAFYIKKSIYRIIGYKRVSAWKQLREVRALMPNGHIKLMKKRKTNFEKRKKRISYLPPYKRLFAKREKRSKLV